MADAKKPFSEALASTLACASLFLVAACGSSPTGDGGGVAAGGPYPAPHPTTPQVVNCRAPSSCNSGPVMTAPKIVPITFQGDALQPSIDAFAAQLGAAGAYWSGATAEYGVGPLTTLAPQHLPVATFLTDADMQAWLSMQITQTAGFPQPDANTIYVVFAPAGTNLTMGPGSTLCGSGPNSFAGYHDDFFYFRVAGYVTYAVVGRCPPPFANVSEMDELSAEASHEIIEAATDPLPTDKPAFDNLDTAHQAWEILAGPEIGDMCAVAANAWFTPKGVTNLVQRVWSNSAAAAGHDPCQPQGMSPYFNSAVVTTDSIQVTGSVFGTFTTQGIHIPIGTSKTVELDLYSDGPTSGPWNVTALDLTSAFYGAQPALAFALDQTQGQNGDKLHLTIHALRASAVGASIFWVVSQLGPDAGPTAPMTTWLGLVGN